MQQEQQKAILAAHRGTDKDKDKSDMRRHWLLPRQFLGACCLFGSVKFAVWLRPPFVMCRFDIRPSLLPLLVALLPLPFAQLIPSSAIFLVNLILLYFHSFPGVCSLCAFLLSLTLHFTLSLFSLLLRQLFTFSDSLSSLSLLISPFLFSLTNFTLSFRCLHFLLSSPFLTIFLPSYNQPPFPSSNILLLLPSYYQSLFLLLISSFFHTPFANQPLPSPRHHFLLFSPPIPSLHLLLSTSYSMPTPHIRNRRYREVISYKDWDTCRNLPLPFSPSQSKSGARRKAYPDLWK